LVIVNINPSSVGTASENVGVSPAKIGTVVVVVDVVEVVVVAAGFTPIFDACPNEPTLPGEGRVATIALSEKSAIVPPLSCSEDVPT
jgi:hypothetical protein